MTEREDKPDAGSIVRNTPSSLTVRPSALVSRGLQDLEENSRKIELANKHAYPYCEELVNERIYGWRFWVLETPLYGKFKTQENRKYQSEIESLAPTATPVWGLEGWSPGKAAEAACISCGNLPGLTCQCGLEAFRDKRFAGVGIPPDISGARPSPCVFGEVIGWGRTIIDERVWRAARAYPLSLVLVCNPCVWVRGYRLASYVLVTDHHTWGSPIIGGAHSIAVCEEHFSADAKQDCFPAREVEAHLMSRYRVSRFPEDELDSIGRVGVF